MATPPAPSTHPQQLPYPKGQGLGSLIAIYSTALVSRAFLSLTQTVEFHNLDSFLSLLEARRSGHDARGLITGIPIAASHSSSAIII